VVVRHRFARRALVGVASLFAAAMAFAGELLVDPDPATFAGGGVAGEFEFEGAFEDLPLGAVVLAGVVGPDDLVLTFRVRSTGFVAIDGVGVATGELPAPSAAGRIPGGGIPVVSASLSNLAAFGPTAIFDVLGSLGVGTSERFFVALPAAALGSPPFDFTLLAASDLAPPVAADASVAVRLLEQFVLGPDRQTIDDFESGPFALSVIGDDSVMLPQTELPDTSVFGRRRTIYLSSGFAGASANAALTTTPGDDAVQFSGVEEATLSFRYGTFEPPVDLTAADTIDRLVVEGVSFGGEGRVNVGIQTAAGTFGIGGRPPTQGVVSYRFDEFPGDPDFTQVESVDLQVILNTTGNASIGRFRAVPEPASPATALTALAALAGLLRSRAGSAR
jgi:hypothetical protein